MRRKLGKNDWILLGTLAAVCLILFCVFRFLSGSGGDRVVITVDGETYGTYSLAEDQEMAVCSTEGRCVVFHTASLNPKSTRSTQGVNIMTLKPKYKVEWARPLADTSIVNAARYRARSLPIAGALLKDEDRGETQMTLDLS